MLIKNAQSYLRQVLNHERCIPFRRYAGATGRTGQAQEFGVTKGRWPEKSVKVILSLLQNLASNAETKRYDVDKMVVTRVVVNQAMKGRRRTYRAHGRINAYLSSNCHVTLVAQLQEQTVKKARPTENTQLAGVNLRTRNRRHLARAMRQNKLVTARNTNANAK
jgi:large subunit ribosomal protein L17e